jgi:hypothetical protein
MHPGLGRVSDASSCPSTTSRNSSMLSHLCGAEGSCNSLPGCRTGRPLRSSRQCRRSPVHLPRRCSGMMSSRERRGEAAPWASSSVVAALWMVQLHSSDGPRMVIVLKPSLPWLNSVTPSLPPCLKSAYLHGQHHGAVVPEVAAPRLGIFAVSGG